ncbi:ROK family transcriptional regulator [Saccharothrix sp. ST-888]|uniref:ROK family transcriptional regulator n=1 Tax=Saccharothrix sp. ST-888 TaxID=1427391 RepID=UPI0005EC8CA1|nr:ROK family transcriptional regulator [Saccharothrix sp. ST-888]
MRETDSRRGGPAGQQGMRWANLGLVLGEIASGPRSRAEVAAATGLTRTAVSSLVDELLTAGLLTESGPAVPSGRVGRPGTALALNPEGPCGLGAEIGVEHLAVCLVDLRGEVRGGQRMEICNRDRESAAVLADLAELLRATADGTALRPAGLRLAVPGLVGGADGIVERAANLGWTGVPAVAELRLALRAAGAGELAGLPIEADNEANLGGLAELWFGGRCGDFVHLSAEAGIGAAIVLGGRLLSGARGFAGELGHVPVRPDGPKCACGARGCLEQYAGQAAVLRAAGLDGVRGDWVALLAERAAAGDPAVLTALTVVGSALGIAAAGAVNLLDPAELVLGGGYAELARWLLPPMRAELANRLTVRPWSDDWLAASGLGRRGPLLGAAAGVVRAIIADPGRFATESAWQAIGAPGL